MEFSTKKEMILEATLHCHRDGYCGNCPYNRYNTLDDDCIGHLMNDVKNILENA